MKIHWIILLPTLFCLGLSLADETRIGLHTFTHPAGFEIEKVAGPPLVDRPIVGDFDELGHLYVADSAGVNDKVEKQLEEKPHRIVRLTDEDGDGTYDRSTVFADRMMFPEGILCHEGAVYCAAPPSIWKLEDTDGDGTADRRTEWFNEGTLTGCANDLHGPYLGPAGWIYWAKGAFAKLDLELGDGRRLTDSAAHLFRARPDGTGLESFAAGGMDNPVDITFGPAGDVFFSSTFLVHPADGKRDGLIHSIYGSVYPKRHGVIDDFPRTDLGDGLMPAMTHLGPAAPSGLEAWRSGQFGQGYEGNLFSALFNMRKIMRHQLVVKGASFETTDTDFVVSDQVDFHPTDLKEDADGSMLIFDTGGWYKLCCPTSVMAKPEVFGGIYRVRKKKAHGVEDPRGNAMEWSEMSAQQLAGHLGDARSVVRDRAIRGLSKLGQAALPVLERALTQKTDEKMALGAIWALARMRTEDSRGLVRIGLESSRAEVRQAAAFVSGLERDEESLSGLLGLLGDGQPPAVQREAATALGRLKNPVACPPLLEAGLLKDPETGKQMAPDRFVEHAAVHALLEINDPGAVRRHHPGGVRSQWRAMLVLDQLPEGQLQAEEVISQVHDAESPLLALLQRHPEWEGTVAARLEASGGEGALFGLEFLHWPAVAGKVSDLLLKGTLPAGVMKALGAQESNQPMVEALLPGIEKALLAGEWGSAEALDRLKIQPDQINVRLETWLNGAASGVDPGGAVRLLARCGKGIPDKGLGLLLGELGSANLKNVRLLGEAALTEEQKKRLASALPKAGLVELPLLLEIFKGGGSIELGESLAAGLVKSPLARTAIPTPLVEGLAVAFPESVRAKLRASIPTRATSTGEEKRLQALLAELPDGDPKEGHQVFKSTKAACATCHRLGYDGGLVGPDLSRIGSIRSRRDLLEAIVSPSASYARGYESTLVTPVEGSTAMGILSRGKDAVFLTDVLGRKTRFATDEIREIKLAPVSLMPAGIDQNLSREALADLIAFLQSLK